MRTAPPILPAVIVTLGLVAFGNVPEAAATPQACQREVAKSLQKFAETKMKALTRCHDGVLTGKLAGPCPDAQTTTVIGKAAAKLRAGIDKKCGGPDQVCGSGTDETLASIGWNVAACPNFESGACTNGIADCGDVADCLLCVGNAAVDQAADLYFGELAPSGSDAVKKCQREIGKSAAKAFRAETKALLKCADARLKGSASGSCPDGKAAGLISRARAKAVAKICQACGGADRACGGADDLDPATIGFADQCPSVTIPGGSACGGPVTSLQQLVSCVSCVTSFKADCTDALGVPTLESYPAACNADPDATPTPGGPTPTPTTTPTPAGDCVLPATPPQVVSLVFLPGLDSDSGWTGIIDDVPYTNNAPFGAAKLANCDFDLESPTCGQCDVVGTTQYRGFPKNCMCFDLDDRDASSRTVCDPDTPSCSGGETCECFNGPVLPVSSGGAPVCIVNRFTAPLTGTINVALAGPHAGESDIAIRVESAVHNGLQLERPCPVCVGDPVFRDGIKGGTCDAGVRAGQPCDVASTHDLFETATFDCPPSSVGNIGNLDIRIPHESTGAVTLTRGTNCSGQSGARCACSTCATAAAEPCNANADCPVGIICGGRRCVGGDNDGTPCTQASECPGGGLCSRPGEPSRQNACLDGVCTENASDPQGPNEGVCEAGPIDRYCSIDTFRSCSSDGDCNPPPAGSCVGCTPDQICQSQLRQCFLDPIVRTGAPGVESAVAAAAYCLGPVASPSINQVTGLPGPGTVKAPLQRFFGPASCGNATVDAGETCDPPQDGACPGECQPDCRCATAFCGDGVAAPPEACDGTDDAACPGACNPDCTCGTFCGDGTTDPGESCDDGNTTDGDGCDGNCTPTGCGNDVQTGAEECDGDDAPACPGNCQGDCTCGPFCGDGTIDAGEQCDGSATGTCPGTCEADCTCAPFCGNDVREGSELCDGVDAAACPGDCQSDCTCPSIGSVTLVVSPGADLDAGWTGTSHDFPWQVGATIPGEIGGCQPPADNLCTFFANVGSYCSGDPSRNCTASSQCAVGQTCQLITYGPPLGLSSGGVPACAIPRFSKDITGTFNAATGEMAFELPASVTVFLGTDVNFPCPYCDCGLPDPNDCQLGASGTCSNNPLLSCTVEGTGAFGPTSNACQPTGAEVTNGGLDLSLKPATTATSTFASSTPCVGNGYQQYDCWGPGQTQPNGCLNACDGGSNDAQACSDDADCPGAPAGACKPLCRQIVGEDVGEGFCPAGPVTQTCAGASQLSCSAAQPCPLGVGPCVTNQQRCFLDPIVRVGVAGLTANVIAGTFFVPATSSAAINQVAGLPGPAGIKLPHDVTVRYCGDGTVNRAAEECDGGDDANCPGACDDLTCTCATVCGNNTIEFGEQCDGTADAACPTLCAAPGTANECECPALCGDGFLASGEQCDPGGTPPGTPPSDEACPGECLPACQCQPPVCGDGVIEGAEVCEIPTLGCGPLQVCVACTQCAP